MIAGVAVKFGNCVEVRLPKPNRHSDCFEYARRNFKSAIFEQPSGGPRQGFYTSSGKYLDRVQALKYVRRVKQPLIEVARHCLFSENLW